ncbi:hypothetical protein PENTCL1PPCAC_25889, partial [Pristionchus entomophagus]
GGGAAAGLSTGARTRVARCATARQRQLIEPRGEPLHQLLPHRQWHLGFLRAENCREMDWLDTGEEGPNRDLSLLYLLDSLRSCSSRWYHTHLLGTESESTE